MSWRRVPPVSSPVVLRGIAAGAAAALGMVSPRRELIAERVRRIFGAREAVLTDSGTSALVLALRAAVPPAGFVAMPAYACIDLIAAAIRAAVSVRFYDVEPATLSPDLDSMRRALGRGVSAVVVAPLYGYPVDAVSIARVASEHGVPVIEDAAQSAGSEMHAKRVGSFGNVSILSFGRGKGTTGGSGGALLVHDAAFLGAAGAAKARLGGSQRGARDLIALSAQWLLGRPSLYALPSAIPALKLGEMVYHEAPEPRAISLAAARTLGWALAVDAAEVRQRRAHATWLLAACANSTRFRAVQPVAGSAPGYLRCAVLDASGTAQPDPRIGALRGYPVTLDEHPATASVLAPGETAGSGARTLRDTLFTLPTHSRMNSGDLQRVASWLGADAASGPPPGQRSGAAA
jgi:dTDP-4-amino-4,6-dideoxygalactose transaminase